MSAVRKTLAPYVEIAQNISFLLLYISYSDFSLEHLSLSTNPSIHPFIHPPQSTNLLMYIPNPTIYPCIHLLVNFKLMDGASNVFY